MLNFFYKLYWLCVKESQRYHLASPCMQSEIYLICKKRRNDRSCCSSDIHTFIHFTATWINRRRQNNSMYRCEPTLDVRIRGAFLVRNFQNFSWPNSCRLQEWKKLVECPRLTPSLTCIGRIRALWPTRSISKILICKWAISERECCWNAPPDVYGRRILTSKFDPGTDRVNIYIGHSP